ncbi:hypothetical protein C8R46DRAFT_1236918 [Mycena filopes]|nr:hypothetical protein C8R46DRAFT_1236918 [Mycena filopes]
MTVPQPPSISNTNYRVRTLNIQRDHSSCGFWMITLAVLIVCRIPIDEECLDRLDAIGIETLKYHWKCILTSWRIEDHGLGYTPVNDFLQYWDQNLEPHADDLYPNCLAPRPAWVSRFDPVKLSQELENLKEIRSYAKSHPFVSFATENMPFTHFSERILKFDSGQADDEIINIFVAIFAHRVKNVADNHFGTLFSRPPPTQDFKILTSFFLPKVLETLQQSEAEGNTNSLSPLSDSHRGKLLKWFKRDNLATLKRLFIPVNFPARVHWFLIVVYATTKKVIVYDSWEENYKNCQDETEVKRTPYATVLAAIVPVIQLLSEASHGIFPQMSPEWAIQAELVPWQANVVDCGFFTIMFMLHLLYLDGINPTDCPPALRISGGAKMRETRVWLATKLIEWCSQNASSASQTSQSGSALLSLESPTKSSQKAQAPEPVVIQREVIEVTDDTPDIPAVEVKEEPMEFELEVPTSDIEEEEELQAVNTEISSPLTPLSSSLPIVQASRIASKSPPVYAVFVRPVTVYGTVPIPTQALKVLPRPTPAFIRNDDAKRVDGGAFWPKPLHLKPHHVAQVLPRPNPALIRNDDAERVVSAAGLLRPNPASTRKNDAKRVAAGAFWPKPLHLKPHHVV